MGAPWAEWSVEGNRFAPVAAYMKRTICDVRRKVRQLQAAQAEADAAAGADADAKGVPTNGAAAAAPGTAEAAEAGAAAAAAALHDAVAAAAAGLHHAASAAALPLVVDGHQLAAGEHLGEPASAEMLAQVGLWWWGAGGGVHRALGSIGRMHKAFGGHGGPVHGCSMRCVCCCCRMAGSGCAAGV